MASFRLYNIQLLPLDTSTTPEVGIEGYRRLFSLLHEASATAHKEKTLLQSAYSLPHETFFSPFTVVAGKKFTYGKWVKFHKAESVVDLYTNRSLFTAGKADTAVSSNYLFRFVFEYEAHRLAVEELGGKLPSAGTLLKALLYLLKPIADENFPAHVLTVNLVSETRMLEQALTEATGFRHVEVRVTFPNGELSNKLKQLKSNNVHVLKAEASSEKEALMPKLPDFIEELVRASAEYGRSKFTYFKEKMGRKQTFSTEAFPEKIYLRTKKNEQEMAFLERVVSKLREVLPKAADTPAG